MSLACYLDMQCDCFLVRRCGGRDPHRSSLLARQPSAPFPLPSQLEDRFRPHQWLIFTLHSWPRTFAEECHMFSKFARGSAQSQAVSQSSTITSLLKLLPDCVDITFCQWKVENCSFENASLISNKSSDKASN